MRLQRRVVAVLCMCMAVLACSGELRPDEKRAELAERGVEAYTRALQTEDRDARLAAFREAQRYFANAADGGAHPDLYVNLGNAALGAQQLGSAVLAYRRALWLDPDHARAVQNLAHARTLLPDWVPQAESSGALDSFFFWHRTLSRSERGQLAAWSFLLAAVLIAWGLRTNQSLPRNLAWLPGVAWLALIGSLILDPSSEAREDVVVTVDEVQGRAADSALAPPLFPAPLPSGTEARVLEERFPWMRIRLANGRDVWVTASSVTRVSPEIG